MPYITANDGKNIWYDVVGDGDPLVLIGGSSIVHRQRDFMLPILQDHFKVILYDQRGAGLSDRAPVGITVEQWVDDLKLILDEIGVKKTHILGTSNGSFIVIRFAAKYPERTGAIVHYGIYKLTGQYRKMSRIGATIIDEFGVGNGSMGAYFLARMFGTPALCEDWVTQRFEENLSPDAWKAMHGAVDVDLTEDLANIKAPQLIMMGETGPLGKDTDYASGTSDLQEMLSDVEAVTISGTNGTFHVFTQPFVCTKAVLAFFGKYASIL